MARTRTCFAADVVLSDDFLALSAPAQALYFKLAFDADNDGALSGLQRLLRAYEAKQEDYSELVSAGFLLDVDGVPFFAHWWCNNITNNRDYRPGSFPEQLAKLVQDGSRKYVPASCSDVQPLDVRGEAIANKERSKTEEINATKQLISSSEEECCEVTDYALQAFKETFGKDLR